MGLRGTDRSRSVEAADERAEKLLRQLPAVLAAAPDTETESRHLAAIAAAARDHAHQDPTVETNAADAAARRRNVFVRNRPMMLMARLGATVLALCVASAGLAVAGVTLPDPARGAAEAVGLPNQEGEENTADTQDAEDVRQDAENRKNENAAAEGKGKGPEAKENGDGPSTESHGDGHGIGDRVSQQAQGENGSPTPQDGRAFGDWVKEQAQDRSRLPTQAQDAPQNGQTQAQGGPETGQTKSQGGSENGQTQSQGGPETGQTQSQSGQETAAEQRSAQGENRP